MLAVFLKAAKPANVADTIEELRGQVSRLFIIVSRSRCLIDRFERRLACVEEVGVEECAAKLEVTKELVQRLERRLGEIMDCFHSEKKHSYIEARELCDVPLSLEDVDVAYLAETISVSQSAAAASIDECASYLENLFKNMNQEIESSIPRSFYLRALA